MGDGTRLAPASDAMFGKAWQNVLTNRGSPNRLVRHRAAHDFDERTKPEFLEPMARTS